MLRVDLDNWKDIANRIDQEILEKFGFVMAAEGRDQQDLLEVLILRQQVKLELLAYLIDYLESNKGNMRQAFYQAVLQYVNENISGSEQRKLFQDGIVTQHNSVAGQIVESVLSAPMYAYTALSNYVASAFPDQTKVKLAEKQYAGARREAMRQKYHLSQPADIEVFDDGVDLGARLFAIRGVDFSELPHKISSLCGEQSEELAHELKEISDICIQLQNPSRFYSDAAYRDLQKVKESLQASKDDCLFEMDEELEDIRTVRQRVGREHARRLRTHQAVDLVDKKLKVLLPESENKHEFEQFKKYWAGIRDYAAVAPCALPRIYHHFDALSVYLRGYLAFKLPNLDLPVAKKLELTSTLTEALIAVNHEINAVQNTMQAWINIDEQRKQDIFSPTQAPRYHNPALHAYFQLHDIVGAHTGALNKSLLGIFRHDERAINSDLCAQLMVCLGQHRKLETDYLENQRSTTPEALFLTVNGAPDLEDSYQMSGQNSIVLQYNEDLTASLLPDPTVKLLAKDDELDREIVKIVNDYVSPDNFALLDELRIRDEEYNLDQELLELGRMIEENQAERERELAELDLDVFMQEQGIIVVNNLTEIQKDTIRQLLKTVQLVLDDVVKSRLQLYLNITNTFADKINDQKHREIIQPLFVDDQVPARVIEWVALIERAASKLNDDAKKLTLRAAYNMVLTPESDKVKQELFAHARSLRGSQHGKRVFGLLYGLAGVFFGVLSTVTFSWCKNAKPVIAEQPVNNEEAESLLADVPEPVSRGGFFAQKTRAMFAKSQQQFQDIEDDKVVARRLRGLTRITNHD